MQLYTALRVSNSSENALEVARRYSVDFIEAPIGIHEVHKCTLLKKEGPDSYALMISDSEDPHIDYRIMISVTGTRKDRTRQLLQELVEDIGIETKQAPPELRTRLATGAPSMYFLF